MATKSDINIPIFDGMDYSNWKIRILKFLQFKKCKDVVMRAKIATDKDEWDDRDVQATNYIYSAITNKQLEYISELDSAYEIIQKFDEMYLKKSTALQIVCRHNLESIKLKNYSEVSLFFDDFEKAVNELKQAGAMVSETEKLNYMLKALPVSYSYIGDLIDVLPEGERTVDYLKSKIKLKHTENVSETSNDTSNAFKADSKPSYICFNCGKPGHLRRECKSGYVNRGRGHSFSYNRGRGFSNYRGRGLPNYRGRGSYINRGRGSGNYHHYNQESQSNSFHTTIANNIYTKRENDKPKKGQINWLLDSGCTDHIINTDEYFNSYEILNKPVKVKIGDGTILEATKIGNIKTYFLVYGQISEVTLTNVFFVKEMKANLLSYSKITDKYSITSRGKLSKIYNNYRKVIAIAIKDERLYKMKSYVYEESLEANMSKNDMTVKEKLHRTLGHINFNNLELMCKNESLEGLPKEIEYEYLKCAICIENKMHNLPFHNNRRKAEGILEIVHTDLNGPHQTTGCNGEKYFLSFIDDYSKLVKVYCIRSKNEVYDYLVQYVNEVQNLTGKMIKELRCDNGKEYINARVFQFAKEKGIIIKPCPAYVHQLNGTAERYNRTLMDMGRCLLSEAKVERRFWPEVIKTAAYLKNRTLTNTIERKTPYEIFFKRKPSVQNLKMYGSRVFVRIPEERRRSKWDKKAEVGILLGYTDTGYRVLINNRVIIARNCDIIEEDVKLCGFEDEEENNIEYKIKKEEKEDKKTQREKDIIKYSENDETSVAESEDEKQNKRSRRQVKPPLRFDEEFGYYCIYCNYCDALVPTDFQEATTCNEAKEWKEAMNREMDSLMKNNTWTLVKKPPKDKKGSHPDSLYRVANDGSVGADKLVRALRLLRWPIALFTVCVALAVFVYFLMPVNMDVEMDTVNTTYWEKTLSEAQSIDKASELTVKPNLNKGTEKSLSKGSKPPEIDFYDSDHNYDLTSVVDIVTETLPKRKLPLPPVFPTHISPEVQYGNEEADLENLRSPKLLKVSTTVPSDSTLKPHITQKPEKPLAIYFRDGNGITTSTEGVSITESITHAESSNDIANYLKQQANKNNMEYAKPEIQIQKSSSSSPLLPHVGTKEMNQQFETTPDVPPEIQEYYRRPVVNADVKFTSGHSKLFGISIEDAENMKSTTQNSLYNTRVSPTLPTWRDRDSTTKKYPINGNFDVPQCRSTRIPLCRGVLPYDLAGPPATIGKVDVTALLPQIEYLVSTNCSQRVRHFVCSLLEPECSPQPYSPQLPCYNFCKAIVDNCEGMMPTELQAMFNCNQYSSNNCATARVPCFTRELACGDGSCVPRDWVCDGTRDCPGGEDELPCSTCEENEYRCSSGMCITKRWLCDGYADCPSGEDEQGDLCRGRSRAGDAFEVDVREPGEELAGSAPAPSVRKPNRLPFPQDKNYGGPRNGENDSSQELLMTSDSNNAFRRNFTRRPSPSRLTPYKRPKPLPIKQESEEKEETTATPIRSTITSHEKRPKPISKNVNTKEDLEESVENINLDDLGLFGDIEKEKNNDSEKKDTKKQRQRPNRFKPTDAPASGTTRLDKTMNKLEKVIDGAAMLRKAASENQQQQDAMESVESKADNKTERFDAYAYNSAHASPCPSDELRCVDGRCITLAQLCDGTVDCSDHADEDNCYT